MKQNKGKIIKEVKFSPDEWDRIIMLSKKYKKLPAAYIREKAVEGKILKTNLWDIIYNSDDDNDERKVIADINGIAKTVNTEKSIFLTDVVNIEKAILSLEDYVHNRLKPFTFQEVNSDWL